jgi:signal transduction histidine kinase
MALPLAVRLLGEVVRAFVTTTAALALTAGVYLGARGVAPLVAPEFRRFVDVGAVGALVLLLVPGQAWLGAAVDRVVLRRTRRRVDALAAFLRTLSPEAGVRECCRRAVAEWRAEAPAIDRRFPNGLGTLEMYELPATLREVLADAEIIGVFPIAGPHRRWGHVFMTTGLLGMVITDEDARVIRTFSDQLALVLETADLLARAVGVERSLAHAEKLAAIGETAARIAHEIRNPVTAARSLAQQLARDPTAPLNAEHAGLILAELERVERQVAALLRFARREEFRFEPTDLGDLVRTTVEQYRPRLAAAGVEVALDLPRDVTPLADREKLRQVLVNLIENAIDALASVPHRRLALAVGRVDGCATLSVRDSGPGVPAEVLPRLFEPFFSLKAGGTGLGLAIVKRTIEAHGGRIEAGSGLGEGLGFRVALPLAGGRTPAP